MHQLIKKGSGRRTAAALFDSRMFIFTLNLSFKKIPDYGFRSKVSDVKNAVVLLGFEAVRNAIISVSVAMALPKTLLFQDFEMMAFWKHSPAVAATSKNMAQKAGGESPTASPVF
jgi:hypothetical protein